MDNPYESPESPTDTVVPPGSLAWTVVKVAGLSFFGLVIILFLLGPLTRGRGVREATRRMQCRYHLTAIGLALHNYHEQYGAFPPAVVRDADGTPLHSWRTLILPFLEQRALYNSIDLTKPWNHPAHQKARETTIPEYRCPSAPLESAKDHTTYLALSGEQFAFHPTLGRGLKEITDGTPNTLLVVEVTADRAIPWMQPQDLDTDSLLANAVASNQNHMGGFQAVFCDGHVRFLSSTIDSETLKAIATVSGNEPLGEF